jgi:hypothetical protein
MHESRPTGAFGFILGLKVTSVASSLGLPWGKGTGSWGASWFVEGLVTELWWARGSWGFTRLRFLARPLCGAGQVERRKKGRQAEEERSKEKGNSSQRSRGTWDPVLPGWSLGESPFEVRTEELVAKVTHGLGPEDALLRGSFGSATMARREAKTRPSYCWKSGMILSQEC